MDRDILDIIIREYDEQMKKNKDERDLRIKKVYKCIPEIEEIDKQGPHDDEQHDERQFEDGTLEGSADSDPLRGGVICVLTSQEEGK